MLTTRTSRWFYKECVANLCIFHACRRLWFSNFLLNFYKNRCPGPIFGRSLDGVMTSSFFFKVSISKYYSIFVISSSHLLYLWMETAKNDEAARSTSVGITLITGFLGAGKSSLIRRVLTENHGLRIVVVENEFGSTAAIEQAIVTQGVGEDALEEFIELPNGCICCQAQDDLVDSLTRLVEKKSGRFDHILIEASGLADPRPVAASFWVDAVADASLHLDSVVSVVDASRLGTDGDFANSDLARKQVAVADIVLLNKMDLVTAENDDIKRVKEEDMTNILRGNGCVAQIIPAVKCDVEIKDLLNIRAYDSDAAVRELKSCDPPEKFQHHVHGADNDNNDDKPLSTFTLTFQDAIFDSALLNRALGHMLWDEEEDSESSDDQETTAKMKPQIWRMKALVVVSDEENKWIYQSVHTLFDDMISSVRADDKTSQFLFIGQNMQKESIYNRLRQATNLVSST